MFGRQPTFLPTLYRPWLIFDGCATGFLIARILFEAKYFLRFTPAVMRIDILIVCIYSGCG